MKHSACCSIVRNAKSAPITARLEVPAFATRTSETFWCAEPQLRHRLNGLNREHSFSNATKTFDNSSKETHTASFGTRGSQVQILPLRPAPQEASYSRQGTQSKKPIGRPAFARQFQPVRHSKSLTRYSKNSWFLLAASLSFLYSPRQLFPVDYLRDAIERVRLGGENFDHPVWHDLFRMWENVLECAAAVNESQNPLLLSRLRRAEEMDGPLEYIRRRFGPFRPSPRFRAARLAKAEVAEVPVSSKEDDRPA